MKSIQVTTLPGYCDQGMGKHKKYDSLEIKEPACLLPMGIEIPFEVGKIYVDCEGWGFELIHGLTFNLDHQYNGETTIAIGAGKGSMEEKDVPPFTLNPGFDAVAKGQVFITFDRSHVLDGGFLWEGELDLRGLGKPIEAKQTFKFAIVKGFTYEGPLTNFGDKVVDWITDHKKEIQLEKKVHIYQPPKGGEK